MIEVRKRETGALLAIMQPSLQQIGESGQQRRYIANFAELLVHCGGVE